MWVSAVRKEKWDYNVFNNVERSLWKLEITNYSQPNQPNENSAKQPKWEKKISPSTTSFIFYFANFISQLYSKRSNNVAHKKLKKKQAQRNIMYTRPLHKFIRSHLTKPEVKCSSITPAHQLLQFQWAWKKSYVYQISLSAKAFFTRL